MSNDELMRQIQRVTARYRRGIPAQEDAKAVPGHQGTGRILSKLVHEGDGISQSALADMVNIRPQSLSEALAKMEERQWICRKPTPQDKRGTLVYLTEEGRAREAELAEHRRQTADALLSVLSESEKELLSELLERILSQKE